MLLLSGMMPISLLNPHLMLQVDKDEFRIRRTFGAKKDEYHVDKKSTTWVWAATSCSTMKRQWLPSYHHCKRSAGVLGLVCASSTLYPP